MTSKARRFYIDHDTFGNIIKLAGLKQISLSAMVTILIHDAFYARYHCGSVTGHRCTEFYPNSKCLEFYDRSNAELYDEYVQMMRYSGPFTDG